MTSGTHARQRPESDQKETTEALRTASVYTGGLSPFKNFLDAGLHLYIRCLPTCICTFLLRVFQASFACGNETGREGSILLPELSGLGSEAGGTAPSPLCPRTCPPLASLTLIRGAIRTSSRQSARMTADGSQKFVRADLLGLPLTNDRTVTGSWTCMLGRWAGLTS